MGFVPSAGDGATWERTASFPTAGKLLPSQSLNPAGNSTEVLANAKEKSGDCSAPAMADQQFRAGYQSPTLLSTPHTCCLTNL